MIISNRKNHRKGELRSIKFDFNNELIMPEELPSKIYITFTSESNAYGTELGKFLDGEPLKFDIEFNHFASAMIKPKRSVFLESTSKCSQLSSYESFGNQFKNVMKRNCKNVCKLVELPGLDIFPACNETELECAKTQMLKALGDMLKSETYFGSCNILEYIGKVEFYAKNFVDNSTVIQYSFKQPETQTFQKEYLVYDTTTFIGSVGGTLGMWIGFSFMNVVHWILDKCEIFLMTYRK